MKTRVFLLAGSAALLAACGSRPVQTPPVVSSSHSDMSKAMLAYSDNRYAEARNFFGRALSQYQSVDDLQHQAEALTDLADCALLQGDVDAAKGYLANAQNLVSQHHLPGLAPRLALLAGYADLQSDDASAAAAGFDGLLNDAATPADVRQAALLARTQAAFDLKAADSGQWLAKLPANSADPLIQARLERLQARAADPAKAAALYADALGRYQAAYYRPGIAASHEEWAELLLSEKQWAEARDHLRRALTVRLWMYDANHSLRILAM
ncbi:MAG TPA: hypothetical protein VGT99_05420, partial [Gammaproteobacteria bacterium]|nr:hypothetical protein [Gammaproteobacteria bacterium]